MMNGPARCRQLDLLTDVVKALETGRIPPATRTEVTRLLKRAMTECVVAEAAQPVEGAADE